MRCLGCGSPLLQVCPRCGAARPLGVARCPGCKDKAEEDMGAFLEMFQEQPTRPVQGRYAVVRTLSRGRVDAVYRVRDEHAEGREYVLKEFSEIALLTGEEKRRARAGFEEWAERWIGLEHRNLVPVLDAFSAGDKHYLLMPLVLGWNVAQLLRSPALELGEEAVCNWGAQLCDLLTYLHSQDPPIIRGELAPEHVMVTREGLIQLVHHGLTRLFLPVTEAASPYAAPEQKAGAMTPAADVYALGVLLYAVLTRRLLDAPSRWRPFFRDVAGVSRRVELAILRATRREPESRFATAADFRGMLWPDALLTLRPLAAWQRLMPAAPTVTAAKRARPSAQVAFSLARAEGGPRLLVRPRRLAVGAVGLQERSQAAITIQNAGQGALEGRLLSQASWITLEGSSFRLGPGQATQIAATVWGARLPRGETLEPQALLVDSNAGRQWISVQARVAVEPVLALQDETLDFGSVQGVKEIAGRISISNAGGGVLKGAVHSRVPWLRIPHPEFHASPGQPVQVEVLLRPKLLAPGTHYQPAALAVDSDAGQAEVAVKVTLLQPILAVSPSFLDFGALLPGEQAERILTIANEGTGSLDYRLRSRVPWLHVSPQPARVLAGERRETFIVADGSHLQEGVTESAQALLVQSNGGVAQVAATVAFLRPRLELAQERLDLQVRPGEIAEQSLTLRNSGNAPLHCCVVSRQKWLTVAPAASCRAELTIEPQGWQTVLVRVDATDLQEAPFARGQVLEIAEALHIASDGGERDIALRLEVWQPALEVEPVRLDFGIVERATPVRRMLVIRNRDTGLLEWEIESDALWVEIVPRRGVCQAGEACEVAVAAYGLALPAEESSATGMLRIVSNGGQRQVGLALSIASPRLDVDVNRLDLGTSLNYAEVENTFLVFNHGLGPLRGRIVSQSERLSVEPDAFECDTGMSQLVRVRARSEGLPAGRVEEPGGVVVESNGGQAELDIVYAVVLRPELEISFQTSEVFPDPGGPYLARGRLTIQNIGQQVAQVEIVPSSERLEITRRTSTIKPGKAARLQVTLNPPFAPGTEELYIEVVTQEQRVRVPIKVEPST